MGRGFPPAHPMQMADRSSKTRVAVALACTECKSRNYKTTKKRDQVIERKKFCKVCGTHTLHRETK